MQIIFLYGPPGSGKSTIGKILSKNLNTRFVDIDDSIEAEEGASISQLLARHGEEYFRDAESCVIQKVCQSAITKSADEGRLVVALGGGALLRDDNLRLCEATGTIVFLEADNVSLLQLLKKDGKERPLLLGDLESNLSQLLERRKKHYDSFNLRISCVEKHVNSSIQYYKDAIKHPERIAWEIQRTLGCYHIRGMGAGYDILIEPGGLKTIGNKLREYKLHGPLVVVSDDKVAPIYSELVLNSIAEAGYAVKLLVFSQGEENKTLETVANLWRGFLAAGLDRKSTVIALGGGVVGDLAGFAAATYMRGCPWVALPTSLLSMVDASIGGKTGFDLPEGKNLVGSFHPPSLVLSDPDVLSTLPVAELRSGLAEVVKHGIISDVDLFSICSKGYDATISDLIRIIRMAVSVKVDIIGKDPFETGRRAALNLGHTVGHAVEIASHYRLRHGEAVAIGLVAEARLAEKLGLVDGGIGLSEHIAEVLKGLGLPTEIPTNMDAGAIVQAMRVDKKKDGRAIKFALPIQIGLVKEGVAVSDLEMVL